MLEDTSEKLLQWVFVEDSKAKRELTSGLIIKKNNWEIKSYENEQQSKRPLNETLKVSYEYVSSKMVDMISTAEETHRKTEETQSLASKRRIYAFFPTILVF